MQEPKALKLLAFIFLSWLCLSAAVLALPVDSANVKPENTINRSTHTTNAEAQAEGSDTFSELRECIKAAGVDINKRLDCLIEYLGTEAFFQPGYADIQSWIEEHRGEIVDCWKEADGDEMKFLNCFLHLIQTDPAEVRFIETIAAIILGDGVATDEIKDRIRGIMIDPNINPQVRCVVLALLLIDIEKAFPGSSLEKFLRVKVAQACGDVDGIEVTGY